MCCTILDSLIQQRKGNKISSTIETHLVESTSDTDVLDPQSHHVAATATVPSIRNAHAPKTFIRYVVQKCAVKNIRSVVCAANALL